MYKKYLTFLFLKKIFYVLITFYCLIFILNLFEEISFFKNLPINKFELIIITFLNIHSTIFIIFPFIFLIAVQLFFIEINEKHEFDLLKVNGLTNLKIILIIGVVSFFLGIIILTTFYNISAKLKFLYLDTKNSFSVDDKYLAVINENGLWIKDKVSNMLLIINAKKINNDTIEDVIINVFDEQFGLKKTIKSKTAHIKNNNWKLNDTVIFVNNEVIKEKDNFLFYSNFTIERISRLFKDLSSRNLIELLKLREDYKNLNYDSDEVDLYLKKIFVFPIQVTFMSLISSMLMLNIKKTKSYTGYLIIGILISVIIYYINMIFNVFATSKIISVNLSIFIPMFVIFCFTLMGFIRVNEK